MNESVISWLAKRRFNRIDMVGMVALVVMINSHGVIAGIAAWFLLIVASVFCELELDKQLIAQGKEKQ